MRPTILLPLAFAFSSALHGQDPLHFPQLTAKWVNTVYDVLPFPPPAQFFLQSATSYCQTLDDTLINGLVYNQLHYCGGAYKGALRDDDERIWYVPGDSTQEYLVYDFNLAMGDTAHHVYFESNGQPMLAQDLLISYTGMDPDLGRNVQYLESGARWIQGIGSAWGLFTEPWVNVSNYELRLECMSNSDTTLFPFKSAGVGVCNFNVGLEEANNPAQLDAFPNPTTDGLMRLRMNSPFAAEGLRLTTADGRMIHVRYKAEGNNTTLLDLSELPPGMYVLTDRSRATSPAQRIVRL